MREDSELKEFRDLMKPPDTFEDGFGWKAVVGGIFVGLIMTPASMYMQLVIGQSVGQAAQWVTIILFIEVARRSFTVLKRPEIYILYYMAGAVLVSSGPGQGLLWQQFVVQSDAMRQFGVADKIPSWYAPRDPDVLGTRSFFQSAWLVPIGLMALAQLIQRFDSFGLGYIMYRLTSDVEKLPFPLAPVNAMGITALADASGGVDSWRWRVFSFGGMLGMAFAAVYIALPSVTGAFLPEPISIFPVPFKDLTTNFEDFLPTVPVILSFNLGFLIAGMVLPFWAMVGSFLGLVATVSMNPVLHHFGLLNQWRPGLGAIQTIQANTLDFYFSFGLGLTLAIAVIGMYHVIGGLLGNRDAGETGRADWKALWNPPKGRGDFSLWLAVGVYIAVTTVTIITAWLLLNAAYAEGTGSPVTKTLIGIFLFYGFIYTPIISYVSARMEGIIGMSVQIPFVREATFILTGYRGAAIWFAPFPIHNYGAQTLYFRTTELTGTKITSMVKAELFIFPVALVSMVVFSHFIWRIAPVPSNAFPYASQFWELSAFNQGLIYSSTLGGQGGPFAEAFKPALVAIGLALALGLYGILSFLGLPVLLVYGVIRGLDQSTPDVILPQFLGALLGRYYFAKKFGPRWPDYRIVFFAGYSAGFGLIMMLSLGLVFMSKSVTQTPY